MQTHRRLESIEFEKKLHRQKDDKWWWIEKLEHMVPKWWLTMTPFPLYVVVEWHLKSPIMIQGGVSLVQYRQRARDDVRSLYWMVRTRVPRLFIRDISEGGVRNWFSSSPHPSRSYILAARMLWKVNQLCARPSMEVVSWLDSLSFPIFCYYFEAILSI